MATNGLDAVFRKRNALICYAPVGDPLFDLGLLEVYEECGVDIIEIGLPNKTPYADGRVIADSMIRMSDGGVTISEIAGLTQKVAVSHPNLMTTWMCYENAEIADLESITSGIGLKALLMVGFDRRADKASLTEAMVRSGVHHISFVGFRAPIEDIEPARKAGGYVFLQAYPGKTGARSECLPLETAKTIRRLYNEGVSAPIVLGFGISTPAQVRQALQAGANGVISGSACVSAALDGAKTLKNYLAGLREALDEHPVSYTV